MADDRHAHQCHRESCDSEARYITKFQVACRAPSITHIVKMNCSIKVCDRHKNEKLLRDYLLSPHNREVITSQLMDSGYPEPDFLTAQIAFEPIQA